MKKRALSFLLTAILLIQMVSLPIIAATDIATDTNETEGLDWDEGIETPAIPTPDDNITYPLEEDEIPRIDWTGTEDEETYTVTWKNYDGTVLETDTDVAYGTTPTYDGATPERESTSEYTYTFSGWTPEASAVKGDVTYTATYFAEKITKPESDVKLTMTGGRARPETEIVIPVTISDNVGLAGLQLSLSYSNALTLKGIETGDALNGLTFTSPGNLLANPITLLLAGEVADDTNGTVFNLTFTVNADTPEGDYDVSITVVDSYDNDMETVHVSNTSTTVTVVHYTPGDVNGDGNVTARDITALSRYIAGGYNVTVVEAALDINRDGNVTARDITTLSRYIAGGYGIELK